MKIPFVSEYFARRRTRQSTKALASAGETSASIADWQQETFGQVTDCTAERLAHSERKIYLALWNADAALAYDRKRPNLSRALRALEEMAELIQMLADNDNDPRAPGECADVDIVLRGIEAAHGSEHGILVQRKMAINRGREWTAAGDGHGQHRK